MEICSDGHAEVVFSGGWASSCPVCDIQSDLIDLEDRVNELESELADAHNENDQLEERIEEMEHFKKQMMHKPQH